MRNFVGILTLPLLVGLSACTATAWSEKFAVETVILPKECAGWQKIDLKQRTILALMRSDPRLVVDIDSHNLRGRNLGCWD
ncbi:hypothetical protein [Phyllobacterium salinisoli]|nr:hypothetical protein [Phyllobacterium salinisoli]